MVQALKQKFSCLVLFFFCTGNFAFSQADIAESKALLMRIVPKHADQFIIESIEKASGKDVFELGSKSKHVLLRGSSGVAIASAFYQYLNEFCHSQITWNGTNLKLPTVLPLPGKLIRNESPYTWRYYLNYCTFNYSMSWWDWPRWEKEIDWMALHGINMPLAITGEEYTWYLVYKEMGFSDEELNGFFTGPAYFSWFWMGNIDSWGGPLPITWMKSHFELQKKILQRQRALGMKPVLPAFTGHVPAAFAKRFPNAKLKSTNWTNGFADTWLLDSEDPKFGEIGKRFLEKQTALLGTDHLYSADTFNENEPPTDDPAFLSKLSARVYDGMRQADPEAVWVMQGWLFYSDRKFWKEPQTEALLNAVPDDKMIILDLATEIEPVWKRTDAFYGKPWIWNMLHNFGGNTTLFGRMETVANEPARALNDLKSGKLSGIGLTMEGIEQNPVLYELMTAHTWNREPIQLTKWLPQYVRNRYGTTDLHAIKAWNTLRHTVYSVPADQYKRDGAESIIQARPTLDSSSRWANTKLNYHPRNLLAAWDELIKAIPSCKNSEGFRYDLVDLTRQVLVNYASPIQQRIVKAYRSKDIPAFKMYSIQFLQLIDDTDRLLATHKDFMLGLWVADARKWGTNASESALYEQNAKNLVTLWGDKDCPLNEYACRQWSGLLSDFYKPRWELYLAKLELALKEGKQIDQQAFITEIKEWEWKWVNSRKDYPVLPSGDPLVVSKNLYQKYSARIVAEYQ